MTDPIRKVQKGRFAPWYHEREISLFEEESRSGWHLVKRSMGEMEYEYDPAAQYRYAIDYRAGHREDRYLELFQEDGWELVGTISDPFERRACVTYTLRPFRPHPAEGCWYIFRKAYDHTLPEEEYRILSEDGELQEKRDALARTYTRHGIGMALCLPIPILLTLLLWPVLRPLLLFIPYCAMAAGIHFHRVRCIRDARGKLPRYRLDTWLKALATLLLAAAITAPSGVLLTNAARISQQMANSSSLNRTALDPADFLINEAGYIGADEAYTVYATDTMTIVLLEDGRSFYFKKASPEDALWYTQTGGVEAEGIYYTVPVCFTTFSDPCRLMGDDGAVYEPIFEAEFETGTLPVFALDVSKGQEYRCLLYTVDEYGLNHYDCCKAEYFGYTDWLAPTDLDVADFSGRELLAAPGGIAFLQSYNGWRGALLASVPDHSEPSAGPVIGISSTHPFSVSHYYPACLVLTQEEGYARLVPEATWITNAYDDRIGQNAEGELFFFQSGTFAADLEPLVRADTVSSDDLQKAAATILDPDAYYLQNKCYGTTLTYAIDPPQELAALWSAVCAGSKS